MSSAALQMMIASVTPKVATANLTMHLNANDSSSYSGSGATWYDISGNNNDLKLMGSPTFTSGSPAYFTFNGSNQYAEGLTTGVLGSTSYSKSAWFRLNGYNDNNILSSMSGGHFMYMNSSNRIYCGHSDWNNYVVFPSVVTFSLSTWYYAACTFSTTNGMKLYVNGVLDSTYTANLNPRPGNGSVNVAAFGVGNLLNGRVSEAFCYNRELTASEILQNYNATKATFGL